MDDMKKLVERYKQELMEYSKAVRAEPEVRVGFVDVTDPEPNGDTDTKANAQTTAEHVTEPQSEAAVERTPQIIGYGGEDIIAQFNDIFGDALPEDSYADDEDEDYGGVSTVTPEVAEGLDDIPESGESPDEQLGKRDFEEQEITQNDPEDIQPLDQQGEAAEPPPEREYANLDEFVRVNDRRGTVRFRTYTARGAFPVAGARIVVSHEIGGKKHVFYALTTDISGQTPEVTLPAPPKELSETPDSITTPYSTYNAEITAEGYNDVFIRDLPVFEGVLSAQNIALVPSLGQQTDVIVETEPDLNGGV